MNASKLLLTLGIWLLGAAFAEGRAFTKVWFGRSEPDGIVVSPDNSTVYVAVLGNVFGTPAPGVVVIDALTGRVTDRFAVGAAPQGLAISPDGSTLYVSCTGSVYVVSTATDTVLQTVTGTSASGSLALNRHGSQLWEVAGNQVSIINTATYEVINNLTLPLSPVDTTESGLNAAFTTNGKAVYITAQYSKTANVKTHKVYGTLFRIDVATQSITSNLPLPFATYGICSDPAEPRRVYLVDSPWHVTAGGCQLYGFDPSTNIAPTVLANSRSGFCAITPNGKYLLLGQGAETVDHESHHDLVMIDLTNNKLTTLSTRVKDVGPIAIAPNGNDAYVISGFHSRNDIPSHIDVVALPQK